MMIRTKLMFLFGAGLSAALAGATLVNGLIERSGSAALEETVEANRRDIEARIAVTSRGALEQAATFARHPAVGRALEMAAEGDLSNEADPAGQQAREYLRAELKPILEGFAKDQGHPLKLHVHLPGVRSLARLWRPKQSRRNDQWLDVSDDLSTFRNTIHDVQRTGAPVLGIELGRGGFTVRGIAPVKRGAEVIGSVEVLESFAPLLSVQVDEGGEFMLFMNASQLEVTTKLQDRAKYPRVAEHWVQVIGPKHGELPADLLALLPAATEDIAMTTQDDMLSAAFPIKDYRGEQIGLIGMRRDVSALTAPTRKSLQQLWLAAILLGLALGTAGYLMLQHSVVRPAQEMAEGLTAIADGGDLAQRLDESRDDELGMCAKGFNCVVERVAALVGGSQKLVDNLCSLPFPVIELNSEQRITFANSAAEAQAGARHGTLEGKAWKDVFRARGVKPAAVVSRVVETKTTVADEGYVQGSEGPIRAQVTAKHIPATGGYLVSWVELERMYAVVGDVRDNAGQIGSASQALNNTSEWIAKTASLLQRQAQGVSGASDALNHHLADAAISVERISERTGAVADAMRQLDTSLSEVAQNTAETAQVARDVDGRSTGASTAMSALEQSVVSIGDVVEVIEDVADQVSLLALNAKIEASSAGPAGAGFGVVADEVKALARQTSGATDEIRARIREISERSAVAVSETSGIREAVNQLRQLSESAAAAVEEQSATVSQVSVSVRDAAETVETMSARVKDASGAADDLNTSARVVDESAKSSADRAGQTLRDAASLAALANQLQSVVQRFNLH